MLKHFQNISIRRKIIFVTTFILLISIIVGFGGIMTLRSVRDDYDYAIENYGFIQGDIGKAIAALGRTDGGVHDTVSFFDSDAIATAQANYETYSVEFVACMQQVYAGLESDADYALYNEIMTTWAEYQTCAVTVMEKGTSSENSWVKKEAQLMLVSDLLPLYNSMYDNMISIMELKVEGGDSTRVSANASVDTAIYLTGILLTVALVLSILMSIALAGSIAKPIKACKEHLELFAKGEFKHEVQVSDRKDEVGAMLNSLHTAQTTLNTVISDTCGMLESMSKGDFDVETKVEEAYVGDLSTILTSVRTITCELSDTLDQITLAAEQVAAGAGQVSTGAQDLAQGAAEQASAVEQLSATITEIAVQARKNAESSDSAIADAQHAGKQVSESAGYVKEMEHAMEQISDSSEEIAKIIATIENIAFQTNILALNAAVEAARAGAAGKGFAVVADEVRNLASKSDEAAKATKELIERSVNAVRNGSNIMDRVSDSLSKTVNYTNQVVDTIGKINEAMEAEAEAITQVTDGIDQIAAVVQTNSATSEQSAAASEELSSQSALMKQKLAGINLYKGSNGQNMTSSAPVYYDPEEIYAPVLGDGGEKY